mgnify:FL=1
MKEADFYRQECEIRKSYMADINMQIFGGNIAACVGSYTTKREVLRYICKRIWFAEVEKRLG